MNRAIKMVALLVLAIICTSSVRGQEIRIRVVDARNGKAINNECVNVSLGPWHGADFSLRRRPMVSLSFISETII
jgi:hypothetical protein